MGKTKTSSLFGCLIIRVQITNFFCLFVCFHILYYGESIASLETGFIIISISIISIVAKETDLCAYRDGLSPHSWEYIRDV